MFPREFITYSDKLYWVYKRTKQSQIKEDHVQEVKSLWDCDIVLKHKNQNDDYIMFLREIPELELVEDS